MPYGERSAEELLYRRPCSLHPDVPAIAVCSDCESFLCRSCHDAGPQGYEPLCPDCRGVAPDAPVEEEERAAAVEPATFLPRLLAGLLDWMLLDGLRAGIYLLLGLEIPRQGEAVPLSAVALAFALHAIYHVLCWARFGATPGKALLGLKVVRAADEGPPGWSSALLRWLGYWVSFLALGLGFLAILWDEQRLAWHDRLAGTQVIRVGAGAQRH